MTYNKKQMQPLIDKYQINPETNTLFHSILEMFDGQTNYQNWAVKMIFSQSMTFDELKTIKAWIDENQSSISKLDKKNIVSYSSKTAISNLLKEMEGLNRISFIKNIISHFNTDQRKVLTSNIFNREYTPMEAYGNENIRKWYDKFSAFNKKPMQRKNKFYSTCSAVRDFNVLAKLISDCLEESYSWNKEDLLAFIEHNTKDCNIIFESDKVVVVEVPSYSSSHKLCGSGRTEWCIARENDYFKRYVTNHDNRKQYFLFDFNRKETDCFAHVGFTIEGGRGIVEAQTTNNYSCLGKYTQGNESYSIHDIFHNFGIKMSKFMSLPTEMASKWNEESFIKLANEKKEAFAIAYNKNGHMIINVLSMSEFKNVIKGTFIRTDNFCIDKNNKLYLFLDFNIPFNEDRSMIVMLYRKDTYGTLSLIKMQDVFGADITKEGYLPKLGISSDDFVNREAIDPSILLHKFIDENDEASAINLIEKEGNNIDVNFEFNQRVPVFTAICNKMFKLFDVIVQNPKFNSKIEDGFGETLLESLIYLYCNEEVGANDEENKSLEKMIKSILDSDSYDLNVLDINNDTAINVACEYPEHLWIVESLVSKKNVNINVVNDFKCAALGSCIRNNNLEALKLIGQRPDLIVTDEDRELAKSFHINLDNYIKPNPGIFKENSKSMTTKESLEKEFAEAMA